MSVSTDEPSILSGRTLNINDLREVMTLLKRHHYNEALYHELGLRLKSSPNTLDKIKKDHRDVHPCFRECLASWLRKVDCKVENPTIDTLIAALRGIGENAVADGINEERKKINGSSQRSEEAIAESTDQKCQSSSDAKPTESADHQKSQSSSSSDAKATGEKYLLSKLFNKKKRKKSRQKDEHSLPDIATASVQLEGNFQRRKSRFLSAWPWKEAEEQEHVIIETDDSMLIHFKEKDGRLKFSYDMTTCIGVHHRKSLDHAKNKWPDSAVEWPERCFKVVDKDDSKTLYLVASDQDTAEEWVKELQRRVNNNKVDKRKGEFGLNDLDKLHDIFIGELESLPWEVLGASLGLLDNTLSKIKQRCTTDEDCLKECLIQWLKWSGVLDGTEEPTCDNLKETLKCIGKEEIAKRVDEEFSPNKGTDKSVQDVKDESVREKAWARSGKAEQHDQAVATANKISCGKMLLDAVTHKMQQNDVGSVLAEICYLSNAWRSSLVTIDNKTSTKIEYHKCFIARGREARYVGFARSVPPKNKTSYSFEKYTNRSLEGCAAMLCFSATTYEEPKPTECFFVVAFRNYAITLLGPPNKTALMILDSPESIEELSDSKHYGNIIRNKEDNPNKLKFACKDDKYRTTFMWAGCGNMADLKFPFIEFHLYMNNDNYHSQSTITVSPPESNA